METIPLALDENNDLTFQVVIQGAQERASSVRFVLEGDRGALHSFKGDRTEGDKVQVVVPPLKPVMGEGVRQAWLEVIAEERFFIPLRLQVDLKESVKVVAASVVVVNESKRAPQQAGASATLLTKPVQKVKSERVAEVADKPKKAELKPRKASKVTDKTASTLSEDQLRDIVKELLTSRR